LLKIRVCDKRETVRELRRRELFFTSALHGSLVDKEHSLSHEKLEMLICNIPGSPQRLPCYPLQSDPRRPNSFATRLCRCFALGHPAKLYRNALFPPHGILHHLSCCVKKQFYMFQSMTAVLLLHLFNYPVITHLHRLLQRMHARLMHKLKPFPLPLLLGIHPRDRPRISLLTHRKSRSSFLYRDSRSSIAKECGTPTSVKMPCHINISTKVV